MINWNIIILNNQFGTIKMARKKKKKEKDALPSTFGMLGGGQTSQPKKKTTSGGLLFGHMAGSTKQAAPALTPVPQQILPVTVNNTASAKQKDSASAKQKDSSVFDTGSGGQVIADNRTWEEMLSDISHWTILPFSHGMECELVICDEEGKYLEGEKVVYILSELIRDGKTTLEKIISNEAKDFPPMPEYIKNKITAMPYVRDDPEKGNNLGFNYQIKNDNVNESIRVDAFGRDGNVTMATIILEIVSPPCQYAEELAYWIGTLFYMAKVCLPKGLHIMSTAINPTMKEYVNGLSHGDHHHCGSFANDYEKVQCYDMARNFLPQIIALTVNSPFINNKPTDVIKHKMVGDKPRYTAPNCIRSIRLFNNTTMLSNSSEPRKYIPYLEGNSLEEDQAHFLEVTQYASLYDARFQDLYPFTKYKTIELRICDAQISICRRIGMALLLEAMYYKARKLIAAGNKVPNVPSETLCFNRRMAIERGLIGLYKTPGLDRNTIQKQDSSFADTYIGPAQKPHRFMFEAVQQMFYYLKDVLVELGYIYSPFLKPLLQSVFGDITYAVPPMTEAEYQLCLYDYKVQQGETPDVFADIKYFTIEYSKDPLQNPLTGDLVLPDYMLT
jgi:glutamate---cysteine ligase / carboxylate-amine ligase